MVGPQVTLTAIPDIPLIRAGDDLVAILLDRMGRADLVLQDGDVLVLCQKIVSKAEGRCARLSAVEPSEDAKALASETEKDPHLVELILQEAREVLRKRRHLIIAEHRLGWVCANAGIDRSNVEQPRDDDVHLLLPEDPDRSALEIRERLHQNRVDRFKPGRWYLQAFHICFFHFSSVSRLSLIQIGISIGAYQK